MTLEELTAKVAELQESNDALATKNRELLGEVKAAKAKAKGAEIDPAEHEGLRTQVEQLQAELAKAQKSSKAETEKLSKALSDKDAALQRYLIDGGLSDALAKAGVAPQFMDAAKALLRQNAAIKADGEQIMAVMGDKELSAAIAEWAASDQGKHFVAAPKNSGGGAPGSTGSGSGKAWKDMTSEERVNLYRTNPQQYEAMKSSQAA
jgi:predicted RNase H-like nuclease (RuvC/YqgF family)